MKRALKAVLAAYASEGLWQNGRLVVGYCMNYFGGAQPGKWWSGIGWTGEGISEIFQPNKLDVE